MEAEQQTGKTQSKKPIANARVGIIDKETGEVIDEGSLIYVRRLAKLVNKSAIP